MMIYSSKHEIEGLIISIAERNRLFSFYFYFFAIRSMHVTSNHENYSLHSLYF